MTRRSPFLELHPFCCFCGGRTAATTEDHQPARAFFDGRHWPEGYNFPSCVRCNDVSRKHENVFAVLVRMGPGFDGSKLQEAEFRKYLDAASNNFPNLIHKMTTNEKRGFYRSEGLKLAPGQTFYELPMAGVNAQLVTDAAYVILTKLFCALHYKHAGSILPAEGRIFIRWITNGYIHRGVGFAEFVELLKSRPKLVRSKIDLTKQFDYVYLADPDGSFSAFFCFFRTFFIGYGLVFADPAMAADDFDPEEMRSPFN
jgi:hypothetical protein